jgi:hypothetical protein
MKKIFSIFIVLVVLGSSCTKDFLNVNDKNPNSASIVPANLVLPAALNTSSRLTNLSTRFDFVYLWYGIWSISPGYAQPSSLVQYNLANSDYEGHFNDSYLNAQNYSYLEKASTGPKLQYYAAVAKIMKAYIFANLVDAYGNVPYSDAFKNAEGILKPKYDDQKTIYEDQIIQLDAAIGLIKSAPADAEGLGDYDIVYGGDMTLWIKFANTLKLRILIHQADMTGRSTYITSAIATTASEGYLGVGEGALANPGFVQSSGKMSPLWETFYKQDGSQQTNFAYYKAGLDACDFFNNNNDPRGIKFFAPYSGALIGGNYFGATLLNTATVSNLGTGLLKSYNQSAPLITDFESLFIQAEACVRGFIPGTAKTFYESAVAQSFAYIGATGAATYLAQAGKPLVNFDLAVTNADKIKLIITQKWIASNGIAPLEIWTDYRRTGYPDFIHWSEDPAKSNPTPPVRLLYPQREISVNEANVLAVGKISPFTSKIFWQNR